jgi:hypothetical protein
VLAKAPLRRFERDEVGDARRRAAGAERRISATRTEAASRKSGEPAAPRGNDGSGVIVTTVSKSARSAGSERSRRARPAPPVSLSNRAAKP